MKKLLTVSIMAVMAVTAANAEIASKAYVDQERDAAKSYTDTKIGTYTGAAEGATTVAQAIALAVSGGTENVVTRSGSEAVGGATTPVYVNASGVVTAGTALEDLAYKDTVGTNEIDAKAVTTAKIDDKAVTSAQLSDAVNASLALADSAQQPETTLAGYGITDAYTKTEVDNALDAKADSTDIANMVTHTGAVGTATTPVYVDANGAVTAGTALEDLAYKDTVGTNEIDAKAVTTAKIDDKAVTSAQLSDAVNASLALADSALQDADITNMVTHTGAVGTATTPVYVDANGAVTAGTALEDLAYKDTVGSTEIDDHAVTLAKLTDLSATCKQSGVECVLKSSSGNIAWEVIQRASNE